MSFRLLLSSSTDLPFSPRADLLDDIDIKDERPLVRRVAKQLGVSQASKNAASASGAAAAAAAAAAAGGTEKKDDQAEASPPEEFIVKVSIVELSEGRILDNLDPSKASTELHVRRNELTNGLFEGVTQVTIKSYSDFETVCLV